MSFFFPDLEDADAVPVPPEEMRLLDLSVEPSDDKQRLRVKVEVTPFQLNQRPHFDFILRDAHGDDVTEASVIEPINRKFEFTLHFRRAETKGKYRLHARAFYPDTPHEHTRELEFEIA
jgi:hypothetical protein